MSDEVLFLGSSGALREELREALAREGRPLVEDGPAALAFVEWAGEGRARVGVASARAPRPWIVAVIAAGDTRAAADAVRAGADDVLLWPTRAAELAARLAAARAPADATLAAWRLLLSAMPEATLIQDRGRVLAVNAALAEMFGLRPGEIQGADLAQLTPPEHRAKVRERALLPAPTVFREEFVGMRRDGTPFPVTVSGMDLPFAGRTLRVATVYDLTERRHIEAELRAREERYRLVSRATHDVVYDWDITTSYVVFNEALTEQLGHPLTGPVPIEFWVDLIHPDDRDRILTSLEAALAERRDQWTDEYRFQRADGRYASVLDRGTFVADETGRPVRMIGAMMDVTERQDMHARLVAADRMASVGTLAAGVAHEINNPLTYVVGSIALAESASARLAPLAGPAGIDHLERIDDALAAAHEGAERVRRIVRDLKTFSRGGDDESPAPVDLRHVVETSLDIASNEIRHRAELVRQLGRVPLVVASESRLGQVALNLVLNAAQAMPEGEARRHRLTVTTGTDDRGRAFLGVSDTGVGIPKDVLGRIFNPFFTTKPVGEGTGLGLAICHSIVKGLGGEIEVTSEPGRGSTFLVTLPAASAEMRAPQPPVSVPALEVVRGRVLVVDDEPAVGRTVALVLGDDHEVERVESAREALERIEAAAADGPYDAIVCDLMMPDMSGMDLHAELAGRRPALAERMLFLTGGAFTPRARAFVEALGTRCMDKPFDASALRAAVAALTATRPGVSPSPS